MGNASNLRPMGSFSKLKGNSLNTGVSDHSSLPSGLYIEVSPSISPIFMKSGRDLFRSQITAILYKTLKRKSTTLYSQA
jgi:uncharacterized protein YigE (DUF2233 family)